MASSTERWWYSPQCLLVFADLALEHCSKRGVSPPAALAKTIGEGRAGAIFALGLARVLGKETWLRLVHSAERAPDVRVVYLDQGGPRGSHRMNVLQLEVVTYTKHSDESLGDFLFNTKLDPSKKRYSANTVTVGYILRGASPSEVIAAHEQLQQRAAPGHCYLIGRVDDIRFQLVQIAPVLKGPHDINLNVAFNSGQMPVAELKRGMSGMTRVSAKPIPTANPFLEGALVLAST